MNFKSTTKTEKSSHRNDLIFFGTLHLIIWLVMCLWFGWWGVLLGFFANCVTDMGLLLTWIWQEKRELSQELAGEQEEELLIQN